MLKQAGFYQALIVCVVLLLGLVVSEAQQPGSQAQPGRQSETKPQPPPTAQEPAVPQQKKEREVKEGETVLKLSSDVVTLSVTVTDSADRVAIGLEQRNFEVFEDKVKQKIEFFSDDDAPASIGIAFDVSGSMKGKLDRAREALKAFIETSHDEDDFFLVGFNQRANLLAEFTDGKTLLNKLSLVDPQGQTALYDAVYLGVEKVKQGRHSRRALLVISDGQDNSSRYGFGELRKLLKESNVHIYCIGITEMGGGASGTLDMQGQGILEEIAQSTGGKAFFPRSAAELEDVTTRIALELRHQYSLGYVPTNVQRDGKWHKISVKVNPLRGQPALFVRAKDGYYAIPK